MSGPSDQPQKVVYVEYCRSCQTHSWCTHHDQAKYHETFLKLSEMIADRHPDIEVIGNMVPSHLIPFKIAENKYIDSNTNKYVVYPQIGSFQITFNGTLIFSKKETNGWPHLPTIQSKIETILDPSYKSPPKKENNSKSPIKISVENTPTKTLPKNEVTKAADEKKTYYKDQTKGFTLTDHFKLYRPKAKLEDKDWLTEKYESDGSSRQISQFGRGQSRESRERSEDFKARMIRDLSGDSKIKEMLKNKRLMLKDQGKKEMIINLDSIEEENAAYDEPGATQRTAQKSKKKKRMQELEDQFSSLENKFNKFQSKVQDIHSKNKEFEFKTQQQLKNSKGKTPQLKKEDSKKAQLKNMPSFQKQGGAYVEKPSKLDIYLNGSEQEKNEKLHRIYGQWKLLKQTAKKNKRMLKNKRAHDQPSSSDEESQATSNAPSSGAILTFKPKMEGKIQKQIANVLAKDRNHKYSAMQTYEHSLNNVASQPKFRTQDHFYNRNHFRKAKVQSSQQTNSTQPVLKVVRNSGNTMSMEALKNISTRQSSSKQTTISQAQSTNFSQSAKKNISQIHDRISRIQEQLNKHKQSKLQLNHDMEVELYRNNKSRSHSSASSDLSSHKKFNIRTSKLPTKKNSQVVASYKVNKMKGKKDMAGVGLAKRGSKFSDLSQKFNSKKITRNEQSLPIQEEDSEYHESKLVSKRSQQKTGQNWKKSSDRLPTTKNRQQKGTKKLQQSPSSNTNRQGKSMSRESQSYSAASESNEGEEKSGRQTAQKDSRIHKYELHDPVTYLKKQKEWRESSSNHPKGKQPKHISQHAEIQAKSPLKANKQEQFRNSQNQQTIARPVKVKTGSKKVKQMQTPTKRSNSRQAKVSSPGKQSNYGQIKRNKKAKSKFSKASPQSHFDDEEGLETGYYQEGSEYQQNAHMPFETGTERENVPQQYVQNERLNHSGRIVRNSSKPLNYYKNEDVCYKGRNYSQRGPVISNESRVHVSGTNEEEQYEASSDRFEAQSRPQESKKSLENDKVEGWKMNTDQEDEMVQSDNEQNVEVEHENQSNVTGNRRNSLDKELQQIEKPDQIKIETPKQKFNSANQSNVDVEKPNQDVENANTPETVQQKVAATQQKKTKKAKKAKKEKKEKLKKLKKEKMQSKVVVTAQQPDVQRQIARNYSQYLKAKVASDLSKTESPQIAHENNEYEDAEVKVNVMYCASVDSIPPAEEVVPANFMDYEPEETITEPNTKVNAAEDIEENNEESEEQSSSEEEESAQEEQAEIVEQKQVAQQKTKQNVVGAVLVPFPVASGSDSVHAQNKKLKTSTQNKVASASPSTTDPIRQTLQDNVYSQAKEASKVKEIGVQKQLTLEVSIQTDQPELEGATIVPVFMPRTNTIHNTVRPASSGRVSTKTIKESQFNSTMNNFMGENKRANFDKKPKKQIQRAHIIEKIFSQDVQQESDKFSYFMNGGEDLIKEEGLVLKAEQIYPQGSLISDSGLQLDLISTKFHNLLKVVQILSQKSQWLVTRLFEDKHGLLKERGFGVWVCQQYKWNCVVLDAHFKVDEHNEPIFSRHQGNQMWFNVLEKALATVLGGYEQLMKTDSAVLFTMLTGCNAISTKIKEDPIKNAKLLHLITDCLRKNYIIHAVKNFDKTKTEQGRESVYYINSIRRSGEDQTLIELSQDAREGFYIKLSKFVQEFCRIEILQLRINHNFGHIDLGVGRPGQLTVIELGFVEEGQGCVTLAYLSEVGSLRAYLYKEQKNKVLKLVGQAKEKLKSHLFFQCAFSEGRYFVFSQVEQKPARITYLGQGLPYMRITEQIHSQGLRNEMAEYLPVNENNEHRVRRSDLESLNEWRDRKAPRFKDNFVESRLRETFVDMVLGRGRRN